MAKKEIDENEKIKLELLDYLKNQVDIEVSSAVKKAESRFVRHKNAVILRKNIIIFLLTAIIVAGMWFLYNDHYFDKFFNNQTVKIEEKNINLEQNPDLKKEYAYFLDNIFINENSKYIKDYYGGNLSLELKLNLAMNLIDFAKLEVDEATTIISDEILKDAYEKIFSDKYESKSFNYNQLDIKYLKSQRIYLANADLAKNESNIVRSIIDVTKENDEVIIKTVEGLIIDGNVYNILDNKKIGKYNANLELYSKKLNLLTYTFKNEKLVNISKSL